MNLRHLLILTLFLHGSAYGQTPKAATPSAAGANGAPAATGTGASGAEANSTTSADTPVSSPASGNAAASGNTAASGSTAATGSAAPSFVGDKVIIAVTLPLTGPYLVLTEDPKQPGRSLAPPASVNGPKAAVELPGAVKKTGSISLSVLEPTAQILARKAVDVKSGAASISFAPADFDRVASLPVQVISNGKAVSTALVELIGPDGKPVGQEQLLPGQGGIVTFKNVPAGKNTVKVNYNDGQTATQEVTVDTATPAANRKAEVTVADAKMTEALKSPAPTATPAGANASQDSAQSAPQGTAEQVSPGDPASNPPGGSPLQGFLGFLVSLAILGLIGFGGYIYIRNNPDVLNKLMGKLPLPDDEPEPLRPPEPPPVQVPPGTCAFCGTAKDPLTGACACTSPVGAPATTVGSAPSGSGPRLVGVSGPLAGRAFPLTSGGITLGRETANDVALEGDQTASRRHARVEGSDGAFTVRDEGSSNGTYLNGARVTESPLRPGDEITVGQTRFRFEI